VSWSQQDDQPAVQDDQPPPEFGLRLVVAEDRTVRMSKLHEPGDFAPVKLDYSRLRRRTLQFFTQLVNSRRLQSRSDLEVLGEHLFATLFAGSVETEFRKLYAEAKARGDPLSVRLSFEEGADEIAALPWEYLFAPIADTGEAGFFLSAEVVLGLSRYFPLDKPVRPKPDSGPLRVLLLVSKPTNLKMKEVEQGDLETAINVSGKVKLHASSDATRTGLIDTIRKHQPHVLHVVGQGRSATRAEIALVGPDGTADWVEENTFADVVTGTDWRPRVVVLHLWESNSEEGETGLSFERLAPVLVRAQIPAVVAMRHPLVRGGGFEFSKHFYQWLAKGETVEAAVHQARWMLSMSATPFSLGAPILCLHSTGGLIRRERAEQPQSSETTSAAPPRQPSRANGAGDSRRKFEPAPSSQPATPEVRTELAAIENSASGVLRAGRDKLDELGLKGTERARLLKKLFELRTQLSGRPIDDHGDYLIDELTNVEASEDPVWQEVLNAVVEDVMMGQGG
jgi:CHAT domain